jgi:hypothetical protein
MKKTLKQTALKNLLKKQTKIKKSKTKLANLQIQEMAMNGAKNKERRAIYHRYKEPLKRVRAEIEAEIKFLTK